MRAPTPSFGLGSAALVSLALLAVGCSDSSEDPSSSSGGKPPADAADESPALRLGFRILRGLPRRAIDVVDRRERVAEQICRAARLLRRPRGAPRRV